MAVGGEPANSVEEDGWWLWTASVEPAVRRCSTGGGRPRRGRVYGDSVDDSLRGHGAALGDGDIAAVTAL